jgi:hypothetical protein
MGQLGFDLYSPARSVMETSYAFMSSATRAAVTQGRHLLPGGVRLVSSMDWSILWLSSVEPCFDRRCKVCVCVR